MDNGATTIWERWDGYTKEHGIGKGGMNSYNHYAYGCVCEWIWEFTIPEGCTASVTLPGESEATLYKSGSHKIVR